MNVPIRVTIDIWSDVMCPWCIIGYRQLCQALDLLADEIVAEVRWRPFELNPDMPPEGEAMATHMLRKYGRAPDPESRTRMIVMAADAGYDMRYQGEGDEPPHRLLNTFLAHKLLRWVLAEHGAERQTQLKLALFDAHFQQRRDISDRAVLCAIAGDMNLDTKQAEAALDDEDLAHAVRIEERRAGEMGISGVPAMLLAERYMVSGAQGVETYVRVLRQVAARA